MNVFKFTDGPKAGTYSCHHYVPSQNKKGEQGWSLLSKNTEAESHFSTFQTTYKSNPEKQGGLLKHGWSALELHFALTK